MTSRRRLWPAVAIGAVLAVALVALLLVPAERSTPRADTESRPEVSAGVTLTPRIVQFGDTVVADVDVTVDNRVVDPDSVQVRQEFSPWRLIGLPRRMRADSGTTSLVRTSYTLRCLIGPCVPPRDTAPLEFNPSQVTYARIGRSGTEHLRVRWPDLVVHSSLAQGDFSRPEAVASPWKADLVSLPPVSYSASPGLVRWLLLAIGAALLLAGGVLAYLAVPRKEPEVEPEPEPEPEPELSPLERALLLLTTESADGSAERRRALELVAEEMEDGGDLGIARRARALAWSEETPTLLETTGLAESVRAWLAVNAPPPEEQPEVEFEREERRAPTP